MQPQECMGYLKEALNGDEPSREYLLSGFDCVRSQAFILQGTGNTPLQKKVYTRIGEIFLHRDIPLVDHVSFCILGAIGLILDTDDTETHEFALLSDWLYGLLLEDEIRREGRLEEGFAKLDRMQSGEPLGDNTGADKLVA